MTSLNQAINELHQAFIDATAFELELNIVLERYWHDACKWGLSPDDLKLVIKSRIRGIAKGERRENCILPRNLAGCETALAEVSEELAAIKAKLRIKVLSAGKAEVLRATGRSDTIPTSPAKHVASVGLIEQLRKAAG